MALIESIKLPASLGGEATPEDAAKAFMRAVTQGLAVVVRDAVEKAIEETATVGASPKVADWAQLVTGCSINMAWATPPGTAMQTVIAQAAPSSTALGGGVGFSVGISITGTF